MVKQGEILLKVLELISEYRYSDGISAEKVKRELIAIRDSINEVLEGFVASSNEETK